MFKQPKYKAKKYAYFTETGQYSMDGSITQAGEHKRIDKGDIKLYKPLVNAGKVIIFDSKMEMDYYKMLLPLMASGVIKNLRLQPEYVLLKKFKDNTGKNKQKLTYKADFEYINSENKIITVDVKGFATSEAKIKRKLFLYAFFNYSRLMWVKWDTKLKVWDDYDEVEKRARARSRAKKVEDKT